MGLFENFFNKIETKAQSGICKNLISSYNIVKKQNPDINKRELYALSLLLRPTYKRGGIGSYRFTKNNRELIINENDNLKDVAKKVMILEASSWLIRSDARTEMKYIVKITMLIDEEFKNFKE